MIILVGRWPSGYLLFKAEDWGLDTRTHKMSNLFGGPCNPSTQEVEMVNAWGKLVNHTAQNQWVLGSTCIPASVNKQTGEQSRKVSSIHFESSPGPATLHACSHPTPHTHCKSRTKIPGTLVCIWTKRWPAARLWTRRQTWTQISILTSEYHWQMIACFSLI